MAKAQFFPIVSKVNGELVAGGPFEHNARYLVNALNALAGKDIVEIGTPVPNNPAYSKSRDPEQIMLATLLAAATATAKRGRNASPVKLVKQA